MTSWKTVLTSVDCPGMQLFFVAMSEGQQTCTLVLKVKRLFQSMSDNKVWLPKLIS